MFEKQEYPPNIVTIRQYVNPTEHTVYAFGDILYNPGKGEIPPDLWIHEQVHAEQQKAFATPDFWWNKYLMDKDFRMSQEVEAYATQLKYIHAHAPKAFKEALFDIASQLSSPLYNLGITYQTAENMVRLKAKTL